MMLEESGPVQLQTTPTLIGAREPLAEATPAPPTPVTTMVPMSITLAATPVHSLKNRFTRTPLVLDRSWDGDEPPHPINLLADRGR
jgi:hypothetical protein